MPRSRSCSQETYSPLVYRSIRSSGSAADLATVPSVASTVGSFDPSAICDEWGDQEGYMQLMECVACVATVRVIAIDPKHGTFQLRMQCQWAFRTQNMTGDTEINFRGVPGVRMPGLNVQVEESRIWKDLSRTSSTTVAWRGFSIFFMAGFKKFHVEDFPFDRQVINLQQLDFVWRSAKDDDDFYNSMKVVWLKVITCSTLSQWITVRPSDSSLYVVTPITTERETSAEKQEFEHSSRFRVELYLQREHEFYVRQIFFVSCMITISACSPLGTPPHDMGDRLSVYGGGLLALVAFKYGIMEHLPSVPYATYTDDFLFYQILTITICTFESLIVYRWRSEDFMVDWIENFTLFIVVAGWLSSLTYVWYRKPKFRTDWKQVHYVSTTEDALLETAQEQLPDFFNPSPFHSTVKSRMTRSSSRLST